MGKILSFLLYFTLAFTFANQASAISSNAEPGFDVVVIGGGIAGLATVEMLHRKGINNVLLLEQAPRAGGKMWTERSAQAEDGPYYERGAELVNTTDVELISLIKDLGLSLTERRFKQQNREEIFLFADRTLSADGRVLTGSLKPFTFEELIEKMHEFPQDRAVLEKIYQLQLRRANSIGIEKRRVNSEIRTTKANLLVTGGVYTQSLLEALMKSEFGVPLAEVNAEVLLDYLRLEKSGDQFKVAIIPESDEKFRVTGGTDSIIQKLETRHQEKIRLNAPVTEVSQINRGEFEIKTSNSRERIRASHVVFAVPAYDLPKIKINSPDLPKERIREAAALPFGTNAKVFLIFNNKFWDSAQSLTHSFTGVGVLESGVQFWDTTENQRSKKGVITLYPGDWPNTKTMQDRRLQQIITQLEMVPGLERLRENLSTTDVQTWKKSYAGTFNVEVSRAPKLFAENNPAQIYFVGSDKDSNIRGEISASFGYMNGAVRTAMRAADRIQINTFDFAGKNIVRPAAPSLKKTCTSLVLSAG